MNQEERIYNLQNALGKRIDRIKELEDQLAIARAERDEAVAAETERADKFVRLFKECHAEHFRLALSMRKALNASPE